MSKKRFKFCPVCAGELKPKKINHNNVPVCQKCGFKFYQNSKPTAGAVIYDKKGKILLSKRAIEPKRGLWDIIGGFLENGEEAIDGLRREVKEEIGVELAVGKIIGIYVDDYKYDNIAQGFYTLNIYYACEIKSGEPEIKEEISQLKWFREDEVPWDKLAFNNTRRALKDFFGQYKQGMPS